MFCDSCMRGLVVIHFRQYCELEVALDSSFNILHESELCYKYTCRCHADYKYGLLTLKLVIFDQYKVLGAKHMLICLRLYPP
jgi:hypothetical protein